MPADEPVTRSAFSGGVQPISVPRPMPQLPQRIWSDEDWRRIRLGYASQDMDEKWDVFAEGEVVFLHRSWTGNGVFAATFAPVADGGWRIVSAMVERDAERYRGTDDAYDCVMLELVISAIVLGEPAADLRSKLVELTRRGSGATDAPAGLIQHSALGLRSNS
ncbi:hypothetical protein [Actinomadura macrotermitis]|uniref:Uncharacterized protein n=1 Tax=Actinomadura macrotermitis TaxID=2585200 RepID=A0A7K0C1I7_9ACTN|nr:hypothetical protein [Actinomadura macrotermitis]MQY07335.1 hypothetical protein [Actinomadura macrotermitis]